MTQVVIVAPCHVPFAIGGAERLWWGLMRHLNDHTPHQADIVKLPAPEGGFWEVADSYRAFSELDVTPYELVVSGKYPAWMVDHPRHVVYKLHPLRGLYDTYPSGWPQCCEVAHPALKGLMALVRGRDHSRAALRESFARVDGLRSPSPRRRLGVRRPAPPAEAFAFPGSLIRELVHFWDAVAQRPGAIARFGAISQAVAGRPDYFPAGADVSVAYPPSDLNGFEPPRPGRHLLTVGRLDAPKRVDLLIRAMAGVPGDAELLIAGTGPQEAMLRELAAGDPRIRFLGYVNDPDLLALYADAVAVLFVPSQEDFGLVALEAMAAAKPVVTTTDAGGPGELVEDGQTGYVCEPDPVDLAARVSALLADPAAASEMGRRAAQRAATVSWDEVTGVIFNGRRVAA